LVKENGETIMNSKETSRKVFLGLAAVTFLLMNCGVQQASDNFYAYYGKINSGQDFEKFSRTGDFADVVVNVGSAQGKLVFWRGTSFLPYWETKQGKWFLDEIIPRKGDGPPERPDKVNTYARIIIGKESPNEIVVAWRYLPVFGTGNPHTGVDAIDFVEEYFTIRPNGTVYRDIKQGTQRIEDWLDPENKQTQTIKLNPSGIESSEVQQGKSARQPKKIAGNPVKESTGTPFLHWKFDEGVGYETVESVTGKAYAIPGHTALWKAGVSGTALGFDGYTTVLSIPATQAPKITGSLTLEGWVAIGAYPWNWAPIVQQGEEARYFLGIGPHATAGFGVEANGKWVALASDQKLDRNRWYHLAATYDANSNQLALYIDGEEVAKGDARKLDSRFEDLGGPIIEVLDGTLKVTGYTTDYEKAPADLASAYPLDVKVGQGRPRPASDPALSASGGNTYSLDGILDEVKVYRRALSAKAVRESYEGIHPGAVVINKPDMEERSLPKARNTGEFGAYYSRLHFYDNWDNMWRFGLYTDVVVEFDDHPSKFIFWRGTNHIPMILNDKDQWYTNAFNETWAKSGGTGCQEPMSDNRSLTNYTRIIENTEARIVLQWRYPLQDVDCIYANYNKNTGWYDVADWYYYIYPDGIATKRMHLWTHGDRDHEWQESEVVHGPNQRPEDNIKTVGTLTMANIKGESHIYSYADGAPRSTNKPAEKQIQILHLTGKYSPFTIGDFKYSYCLSHPLIIYPYSAFPTWNHWPVGQIASDGRKLTFPDRVSHSSLVHHWWDPYADVLPEDSPTPYYAKTLMEGMTDKSAMELIPLAKSWLKPAQFRVHSGASDARYVSPERAYVMTAQDSEISLTVDASEESPVVNLALEVNNWNTAEKGEVTVNGMVVKAKQGISRDMRGVFKNVIFIELESNQAMNIDISGANP
jgi:hypothetical protein